MASENVRHLKTTAAERFTFKKIYFKNKFAFDFFFYVKNDF